MNTMNLSNLHTYHQQRLLQSFSALHPSHYKVLSNHCCINSALSTSTGEIVQESLSLQQPALEPGRLYIIPETELPKLEAPQTAPPPAPTILRKPQMVWKPGHGAIEKVDKFTGEIMHLVEERLAMAADALFSPT